MDELSAKRLPSLTAVMTAFWLVAATCTMRICMDEGDGHIGAVLALAAVVGAANGQFMTWYCRRTRPGGPVASRLLPPLLLWSAGAAIVGYAGAVAAYTPLLEYFTSRYVLWWGVDGVGFGLVAAVVTFPLCAWLMARTVRASRARTGSVVASADRWSVVSALATSMGLMVLVALLLNDDQRSPTVRGWFLLFAMLSLFLVSFAYLRIAQHCRELDMAAILAGRLELMDRSLEMDADAAGALPLLDVGLGQELYGAVSTAESYRRSAVAEPKLAGVADIARMSVRQSRQAAGLQLIFVGLVSSAALLMVV